MKIIQLSGGLGNQLFQYSLEKYLRHLGVEDEVFFDTTWYAEKKKQHEKFILDSLKLKSSQCEHNFPYIFKNKYLRKSIEVAQNLYDFRLVATDGLKDRSWLKDYFYYRGFWQTEEVARCFDVNLLDEFMEEMNQKPHLLKIKDLISSANSVSVHVRRGDYLTNRSFGVRTHWPLDLKYYTDSFEILRSYGADVRLFIFSDDISWAKDNIHVPDFEVEYIDPLNFDSLESLYLMLLCKSYIIANSTYSWWPAFLSRDSATLVIAPQDFRLSTAFGGGRNIVLIKPRN